MKYYKIAYLILQLNCQNITAIAQELEAQYKVTKDIYVKEENGNEKLITTLEYKGYLYKKENAYISFIKPLYLDKYPTGMIDRKVSDLNLYTNTVSIDTFQHINYANFDSLLLRTRNTPSYGAGSNSTRSFERGLSEWKILPDLKEINGLKCQKATLFFQSINKIGFTAWFCPEIPTEYNPAGIRDLPGLVIEVDCHAIDQKWMLESYRIGGTIHDSIFWPMEFNYPFKELLPLKKKSNTKATKSNDAQKRLEITNQ